MLLLHSTACISLPELCVCLLLPTFSLMSLIHSRSRTRHHSGCRRMAATEQELKSQREHWVTNQNWTSTGRHRKNLQVPTASSSVGLLYAHSKALQKPQRSKCAQSQPPSALWAVPLSTAEYCPASLKMLSACLVIVQDRRNARSCNGADWRSVLGRDPAFSTN